MKYLIIILFGFTCTVHVHSQSNSFSLEEAISFTLVHSDQIKLERLELADAVASVREFKSIGLPKVNANLNYQYNIIKQSQAVEDFISPSVYGVLFSENVLEERELGPPESFEFSFNTNHFVVGGIEASTLLFDGSYLVGLQAAKFYTDLVEKSMSVTEQELVANTTKAYLACLILDENEKVLNGNIEVLKKIEKETKTIYNEGFAEQLDVDRLTLTVYNLENQLNQLRKNKQLNLNFLKFQMNYPASDEITLANSLMQLFPLEMLDQMDLPTDGAYKNRAEFDELNAAQILNETDLKRIEKGNLPSIRASAGLSASLQRNNLFDENQAGLLPASFVGLGISVPIYDGNERSAQVQRREIAIEKTSLQIEQLTKAIQLEVKNATIAYFNAKDNLEFAKKSLRLSQNIYDKAVIKYKEGVGSSLELNQAEQALFQQQAAYINALYELVTSKVNIEIATGQLK